MLPGVLLFTCERWPTAALLADALVNSGLRVGALRPTGHPLAVLGSVDFQRDYRLGRRHADLAEAIDALKPDIIIPCDDLAVAVLHEHHARLCGRKDPGGHAALIERSLGDPAHFATARQKSLFVALAKAHGVTTPRSKALRTLADLEAGVADGRWPKVLKADGWYGGRGTRVVRNRTEAATAHAALDRAWRWPTRLKDAVRELSPQPFHRGNLIGQATLTLQDFIAGPPVTRSVFCWQGKVIAGRTFEAVVTMPNNGHATVVRTRDIPAVDAAVERCVALLGLSGLAGFDFIHDRQEDRAYLLEVNPRATAGCYAAPLGTPPMVRALADFLMQPSAAPAPATAAADSLIVLFPQEMERDPSSPYLLLDGHLLPEHQPNLIEVCRRRASHVSPMVRLSGELKRISGALAGRQPAVRLFDAEA